MEAAEVAPCTPHGWHLPGQLDSFSVAGAGGWENLWCWMDSDNFKVLASFWVSFNSFFLPTNRCLPDLSVYLPQEVNVQTLIYEVYVQNLILIYRYPVYAGMLRVVVTLVRLFFSLRISLPLSNMFMVTRLPMKIEGFGVFAPWSCIQNRTWKTWGAKTQNHIDLKSQTYEFHQTWLIKPRSPGYTVCQILPPFPHW